MKTLSKTHMFDGAMGKYSHDSNVIGLPMAFNVFVPPGKGPFPALYFLSGLTCTPNNFTEKAGAQKLAAELGIVLVMPDTSPRGANIDGEDEGWDFGSGAGFYVDATQSPWSKHYKMYSYIADELPKVIDNEFPVNDKKSIMGHSMGGHGALVIGLRNPSEWQSISALAPISSPTDCPWGQKAFNGYLGADKETWAPYDATALVKSGATHPTPLLMDQGTGDNFYVDKQLLPETLAKALSEKSIPYTLNLREGYDHSYYFIASFIDDHISHHSKYLK